MNDNLKTIIYIDLVVYTSWSDCMDCSEGTLVMLPVCPVVRSVF